ncbi:MAG: alpha-N-acetylglucosaminidase C-terminal domain-containing protein [Clostridia bacterium]|nr:alpha-N-acetylglucosaminidase C-terminal domain-containing protein [Clostridia bacterium]
MEIKRNYVEIKKDNIPDVFDEGAVYALITRVAGKAYADMILLEKIDGDGFDYFEVSDTDSGKILIKAPNGLSAAVGFNHYLKERCGYTVGALSVSGTFPETPPKVGEKIQKKSKFIYRYFFNFCTFCYTYAFDDWADWEKTLDYLILSGYNLILNPIGIESVWRETLKRLNYRIEDIDKFLCGPAFYAWQWMMNQTGWLGGAPEWWYDLRKELSGKFNERLQSFGAGIVGVGYIGMVPPDFTTYFPDSLPANQGAWFGYDRPPLLLPDDVNYDKVADIFYDEYSKIKGADKICYFSADPFHEGGKADGIDLAFYGRLNFLKMKKFNEKAVWIMQGWSTPRPEIIAAVPDGRIMIVDLVADTKAADKNMFHGAPWLYCAVNAYGGQYNFQGDAESLLLNPFDRLNDDISNIIGIGYMPEAVNCNEIFFDIVVENSFGNGYKDLEEYLNNYVNTYYGKKEPEIVFAWKELCEKALNGKQLISGESALLTRPSLSVEHVSTWSVKPNPFADQTVFIKYIEVMLKYYDELKNRAAYRKDLAEATRQAISNLSWYFVERIKRSYALKDGEALSAFGKELLSLFELQSAVVATEKDLLLGVWLEKAKRWGKTSAERAYFELNARTQITVWGSESAAIYLHDYAAREWQGLLEDFYKPRWEEFISRLEISLFTGAKIEKTSPYDEEIPFVYRKKCYPTEPFGNLKDAAENALKKIKGVRIEEKESSKNQKSFYENVKENF